MNSITLEAKKTEAAKLILGADNEPAVDKIIAYAKKVLQPTPLSSPCQMTVEELRAEVLEAVEEIKNGQGIPHEKVFAEIEKILTK